MAALGGVHSPTRASPPDAPSLPLWCLIELSGIQAPTSLKEIFAVHVMCDYTPRDPKSLPTSRWATLEELVSKLRQHAPMEVLKLGHQNLRQMITEWYKLDPAFAGLAYSAWGKRLKDNTPDAHARSLLFKFCLEHTPAAKGKT